MKEYTCCFSGPRPHKLSWKNNENDINCIALKYRLFVEIEKKIKVGYKYFISGMAQGFDIYCAEMIIELKKFYPHIKLECAVPYEQQGKLLNNIDLERYLNIISKSDHVCILTKHYTPECLAKRNRYMVDKSSFLICFYNGNKGGTKYTYEYAVKNELEILNLIENSD